jgi:hypothetical protein
LSAVSTTAATAATILHTWTARLAADLAQLPYGAGRGVGGETTRRGGEVSDFGESTGEIEMGATVEPYTRYQYRFDCASCGMQGQLFDTEQEAQSDGLAHEHSYHPRVYTIEQVGAYD